MNSFLAHAGRIAVTLAVVAVAALTGRGLWDYYMNDPWTRDAHVRADVVKVASDVSGLVDEVLVRDNSVVHRGEVLFRVDKRRFEIALQQAEAALAGRLAARDQARRELGRSHNLGDFASRQRKEQAEAALNEAEAACRQALAEVELAKLNLARSEVRAAANGVISNLTLQAGDYVATGTSVMALINTDSLRVEGYFEETKLPRIRLGERVTIQLMGQSGVLHGQVESIAGGIEDRERSGGSGLLANVNPTFTWVRLAQRVPVRIRLEDIPPETRLVVGVTATVQVGEPVSVLEKLIGHGYRTRHAAGASAASRPAGAGGPAGGTSTPA
ncbi:HlyD family secretion protein [Siccirubricoccus sp. KC 17139]|uniref:HlyD family secretion protein n=1 Tax=Siccirubricoccus soli TaxID=2899147 RepID=A0ABT1D5W7_9PROT|nr:HlyD family secretion protein [Siccirubricoccus soli]MCO6417323.1 HlyD family secretion protein [Siccirubricoccus soli]MCP2683458.1 HlyD family secretion protein [Siccirubricoccus soli]